MAKKKNTPKSSTGQKTIMKIAGTLGQIAGEIAVKKDQLAHITSEAIDTVKAKIHDLSTPKKVKSSVKKVVKKALKSASKKINKTAIPKATKAKKVVKKAVDKAVKKTVKKVVNKAKKKVAPKK